MSFELRLLGDSDLDAVVDCFQRAFADYIVQLKLTREDLLHMMARRGADLSVSAGAFQGDDMVAVMVVALDDFESILSAYDVFTGVVPQARGQALARRLFDTAMPALQAREARRFVLEVIQQNGPAVHSYRKAGFEVRRELRVFAFDEIMPSGVGVESCSLEEAFATVPIQTVAPSWQNSDASIRRVADDVVALRAHENGSTLGVAFCVPRNRDLPQVHVLPGRTDALQALLHEARRRNEGPGPLRVVNVDADAVDFCDALKEMASEEYPPQFEMVKAL